MTSIKPPVENPETFYEKLLSFVYEQDKDQMEKIRNNYPAIQVCKDDQNYQNCIGFCIKVSKAWIKRTPPSLPDNKTMTRPNMEKINEDKIRILDLQKYCITEYDTQIFSYFLWFCGILFLLSETKDKGHRQKLREHICSLPYHSFVTIH